MSQPPATPEERAAYPFLTPDRREACREAVVIELKTMLDSPDYNVRENARNMLTNPTSHYYQRPAALEGTSDEVPF